MAGSNITNAQAGVRLASARLQAATAARENAALQLSYTKITAPEAGIVTFIRAVPSLKKGDTVANVGVVKR